ncbi:MAG: 2-C-methyl-D-erythritol 2,4-cyclodiphosphate synthase [Candidatus Dormibacteria bacterium]
MSARRIPGLGLGVDVHRFGGAGPIWVGGVEIAWEQGLVGHSDADVLCHAIADAILGAAGMGDLGEHFPSDDARWRGVASTVILAQVAAMLAPSGLLLQGVDGTVIAEAPRLAPHRREMVEVLSQVLGLPDGAVSVKLKSSDGLGLTGRGEGMAALAVASVTVASPRTAQ